MPLHLAVDADSAVPVYEQLRSQIAGAIAGGELVADERLPAARALAADLGIAVNTVIRAYRELSRDGLISPRRRFGTTVASDVDRSVPVDVQAAATRLVMRAASAGLTTDTVVDLVRSTAGRLAPADR